MSHFTGRCFPEQAERYRVLECALDESLGDVATEILCDLRVADRSFERNLLWHAIALNQLQRGGCAMLRQISSLPDNTIA